MGCHKKERESYWKYHLEIDSILFQQRHLSNIEEFS